MLSAASSLALLADESISSWRLRHPFIIPTVRMPLGVHDKDFGPLQLKRSNIPASVIAHLRKAAKAPDSWLLMPGKCRQFCPRCLAEDLVSGQTPYARRAWRIAWHTCCQQHGLYDLECNVATLNGLETAIRFPLMGILHPKWNAPAELHFEARCSTAEGRGQQVTTFRMPLVGRRAVHLENALSRYTFSNNRQWHPRGLNASALREVYAAIAKILVKQFSIGLLPSIWGVIDITRQHDPKRFNSVAWKHLGMFCRLTPKDRFSINVMVEAILSTWTESPLPDEAGAHTYTEQLVKAVGWEFGVPGQIKSGSRRRKAGPLWRALLAKQQNETSCTANKPSPNHANSKSLPEIDSRARMLEMRRFYQGHKRVLGVIRYYEAMKIKEKRDLQSKDRI